MDPDADGDGNGLPDQWEEDNRDGSELVLPVQTQTERQYRIWGSPDLGDWSLLDTLNGDGFLVEWRYLLSNLAELVAYQHDSVVSRTVVKKSAGSVTLFAFDKDQGLSEHSAPYDAMVCILDGQAEITLAGMPTMVK